MIQVDNGLFFEQKQGTMGKSPLFTAREISECHAVLFGIQI